jgi:hypothetical protein
MPDLILHPAVENVIRQSDEESQVLRHIGQILFFQRLFGDFLPVKKDASLVSGFKPTTDSRRRLRCRSKLDMTRPLLLQ